MHPQPLAPHAENFEVNNTEMEHFTCGNVSNHIDYSNTFGGFLQKKKHNILQRLTAQVSILVSQTI